MKSNKKNGNKTETRNDKLTIKRKDKGQTGSKTETSLQTANRARPWPCYKISPAGS